MRFRHTLRCILCFSLATLFLFPVSCAEKGNGADNTSSGELTTDKTENTTADTSTAAPSPEFQITLNDKNAQVKTEEGLEYTASGYTSYKEAARVFTVPAGRELTFELSDNDFGEEFNKFSVKYSSDTPLKCTVTYKEDSKTTDDIFYLEAGESTAAFLTLNYLNGKKSVEISKLTVSSCKKSGVARVMLYDVGTEVAKVYEGNIYYIENDRFKLGVQLNWGGGIAYIEDKRCTVDGITNLINRADTGRLVQQSYYGTRDNDEYTAGIYNGSKWAYNPVQGGDVAQNHSRLIDIKVENDSVYVKSQPQDWSLDNQITPSYMENTYTISGEYIKVDNRFVDFSGWTHPASHQELPAFYTLSYFGRFTMYEGTKPWTNDTLTHRDNEQFWGDPQYNPGCYHTFDEKNTEQWCAWTNPDDNYGIGLFVPNVEMLLAGRFSYNGSKDPTNGATNYVAPLRTMRMVSFKPIEYSYLITSGSLEEIRSVFAANKAFATNASLKN